MKKFWDKFWDKVWDIIPTVWAVLWVLIITFASVSLLITVGKWMLSVIGVL